jgi:hypothetical protein
VTPEQRRARGIAAQLLIDDVTVKDAFDQIEADLRKSWESCWLPRKRDRLWVELRTIRQFRKNLASFAGHAPRD